MKSLKKFVKNRYFLYHVKWQSGFFVIYPTTNLLLSYGVPLWLTVISSSAVGAVIFWFIDKRIFSKDNK